MWKPSTAQKMKFSFKDVFSKFDQLRSLLWIWSHLLNKSFMEKFIFCAVQLGLHHLIQQTFLNALDQLDSDQIFDPLINFGRNLT